MKLIDVISVETTPNYELLLEFENGEKKIFDFKPELRYPVFWKLNDQKLFDMARVEHGGVVWDENTDISPEYLYDLSQPIAL